MLTSNLAIMFQVSVLIPILTSKFFKFIATTGRLAHLLKDSTKVRSSKHDQLIEQQLEKIKEQDPVEG